MVGLEFASILILGVMAAGIGAFMLFANSWWGPKKPSAIKYEPFECGKDPIALPEGKLPVHFYVAAMIFVALDVELVFLFPWAVNARALGREGLVWMGGFILIVVVAFLYAWKAGALNWGSTSKRARDFSARIRAEK